MASPRKPLDRPKAGDIVLFLAIAVYFVDYNFIDESPIGPISLPKLMAGAVVLLQLFVIRRYDCGWILPLFAILVSWCYSAAYVFGRYDSSGLPAALFNTWIIFLFSASIYFSIKTTRGWQKLATYWITLATISAVFAILESGRIVPLFTVQNLDRVQDAAVGSFRGVGLKGDPNDEALLLCVGYGLSFLYRTRLATLCRVCIAVGIVSTFSRMGMILAVPITVIATRAQWRFSHPLAILVKFLIVCIILCLAIPITLTVVPSSAKQYLAERFSEAVEGADNVSSGKGGALGLGSANSRGFLAEIAMGIIKDNWNTGVGPHIREIMARESDNDNVVPHNTVLDFLLVGGIWGVMEIIFMICVCVGALRKPSERLDDHTLTHGMIFRRVMIAFVPASMFLSLGVQMLGWLPMILSSAVLDTKDDAPERIKYAIVRNSNWKKKISTMGAKGED